VKQLATFGSVRLFIPPVDSDIYEPCEFW